MKKSLDIAIIDYGMSNLYSVDLACKKLGINSLITSNKDEIKSARGIILPGVGAFDHAMHNLKNKKLDKAILSFIDSGKPFLGICLGMQLIMEESSEFLSSKGLGLIEGNCEKFNYQISENISFPVPEVGWNNIIKEDASWKNTLLVNNEDKDYMYFVHSFYVRPQKKIITSFSNYGKYKYCSSLKFENINAMQFHPEKSGVKGMKIYRAFFDSLKKG